jgi:mRNA interferase YafQ
MNNIYEIKKTAKFKKELKIAIKRKYDIALLEEIVCLLACGKPLPEKHKDHVLVGNWAGYRECHITPDWLLIYRIEDDVLVLTLTRIGSHSDLY